MTDIPVDLYYTPRHEWVRVADSVGRVGVTSHAAEAIRDIVFVSLPGVGTTVAIGDSCAEIESVKAVSDVFAPVAGQVVAVNEALAVAPDVIGTDPYGQGWLFEVALDGPLPPELLDAPAYGRLLADSDS